VIFKISPVSGVPICVLFLFIKFIETYCSHWPLYHIDRYPYVTGTSIIALKYKDGVIMACDTGGLSLVRLQCYIILSPMGTQCYFLFAASYGSTLRYKSVERIKAVGKHSLIGASGEFSDFQEILRYLDELT
jgi:20S proteasome subunit beta 7